MIGDSVATEQTRSFLDQEYGWIREEPYLSRTAERRLLIAAKNGNTDARDQIFRSWFHLQLYEAARCCRTLEFFPDLVQCGSLGVLRAIDRFDVSLRYRFSTYALWWIRQSVLQNTPHAACLVHLPAYIWNDKSARGRNRVKTVPVESAELAISSEPNQELSAAMAAAIKTLGERERFIIEFRMFGDTLKEIGDALNITRERVRQIESKAYDHLREYLADFCDYRSSPVRTGVDTHAGMAEDQTAIHFYESTTRLPTLLRTVKDWVAETAFVRPQLSDRGMRKTVDRASLAEFFSGYANEPPALGLPGMSDVVGDRRMITDRLLEAIGLQRIWKLTWRGERCWLEVRCGEKHTLHLDIDGDHFILGVELRNVASCATDAASHLIAFPGFHIRTELLADRRAAFVRSIVSRRAKASDLGIIFQTLIRCARNNEIRAAILSDAVGAAPRTTSHAASAYLRAAV